MDPHHHGPRATCAGCPYVQRQAVFCVAVTLSPRVTLAVLGIGRVVIEGLRAGRAESRGLKDLTPGRHFLWCGPAKGSDWSLCKRDAQECLHSTSHQALHWAGCCLHDASPACLGVSVSSVSDGLWSSSGSLRLSIGLRQRPGVESGSLARFEAKAGTGLQRHVCRCALSAPDAPSSCAGCRIRQKAFVSPPALVPPAIPEALVSCVVPAGNNTSGG
mmetsp:Transcript_35250/g.82221  ORF Transcript_35250/g.82221 Transcript_35250/m.82221 type:complete len:217 (+) Transcript_35250:1455-2105(+)